MLRWTWSLGLAVLLAGGHVAQAGEPSAGMELAQATAKKKPASKTTPKAMKPGSKAAKSASAAYDPESPWPQYLGPDRNNISRETGLADAWPESGPKVVWTAENLGVGYSSLSVAKGRIFTIGSIGEDEFVIALELDSGKELWKTRIGSTRKDGMGDGPRGTPTVDGDFVYSLGANGDLACCEVSGGQLAWTVNILKEFKGNNIGWGISESVFVDGDMVICTPGGSEATLAALNKSTGKTIWKSVAPGGSSAGYASVVPIEVGGVRQYVQFVHKGTMGIRARDGKPMWANDRSHNGTANCSSAVFADNMLFTSSGYGTGGAMLKLSSKGGETKAEFGYFTKDMESHHGGMVLADGCIYGSSDPGILRCLDLKTGDKKWENRSVGKGAITAVDGKLILRAETGPVALVKLSSDKYEELGRFEPSEKSGRQAWAYPVVAKGKLFLRDQDKMTAYDVINP
jgi:outer membrane protein assembly factor BamB